MFGVAFGLDHYRGMDPVPVDKIQPRHKSYGQHRTDQQFASARGSRRLGAGVDWFSRSATRRAFRLIQVHIFSLNSYPFLCA